MTTMVSISENIGWWQGFRTLYHKESRAWWGTRLWVVQAGLWLLVANGLLALVLFARPVLARIASNTEGELFTTNAIDAGLSLFFKVSALGFAVTMCVLSQSQIIGEKQRGTIDWILSKPIARSAFILAKLAANLVGVLVVLIGLQAGVAYALVSLYHGALYAPAQFLAATGMLTLHTVFYLVLSLMLGVLSDRRAVVLGVGLGSALGTTPLLMLAPPVAWVTPWAMPDIATALAAGVGLQQGMALSATVVVSLMTVAFLSLALWKFERAEL